MQVKPEPLKLPLAKAVENPRFAESVRRVRRVSAGSLRSGRSSDWTGATAGSKRQNDGSKTRDNNIPQPVPQG